LIHGFRPVTKQFVHLSTHTEFSLQDSIIRIPELIDAAVKNFMPAIAITDMVNLFALVKFYRCALNSGIKPIIGADMWIENTTDHNKPYRIILLCQNKTGYQNLSELISKAYIDGQHTDKPCISKDWLFEHSQGLIALSGAQKGDVGAALISGNQKLIRKLIQEYLKYFPDAFYLEIQRTGHRLQEECNHASLHIAAELNVPVVATNSIVFIEPDDYEAHEVRVCIQDGRVLNDSRRHRKYSQQQYFRSSEEMSELFADIPEALQNTVEIAKRCNFKLVFGKYYLPNYPVPDSKDIDQVLIENAETGLSKHLLQDLDKIEHAGYRERLKEELNVIIKMGFSGYFLIVADFIRWAKENDVPVGPGRGSGAGSLVAFALSITALDPIKYDLLFERFLNPERVSLPDFDIDFCIEGRDRVIEYVTQKYGNDKVSQIITHGTMAAKAVVRDVGRVMDHPYGYVDKLAKLIPFEIGMTLDKALEQEPALREKYEQEEDVRELIDTAKSLEGLARNAGKHAGGVVIAPTALSDFMPLYCEQGGKQLVTQLDKDDLETLGLVKFDFLGLRNLTIINKAVKLINVDRKKRNDPLLEIDQIQIDDADTFTLLKACKTTATFQLESRGMKDLIKRLQPDSFEEIIALVALFRPGPLQSGMVDDFIDRKHGRKKIQYPHPLLEPILKPTYGVILYQEQVMQIAQVLSGYSLGGADLLRRAMGKKKPEEMAQQRNTFINGAIQNSVKENLATKIFDQIEKFAGYGFNRSHSAAYALIAYQTAWLKAHYPSAFMAAVLSSDMDNTDKVVTMLAECHDMDITILPPDINHCDYLFKPCDDKTIYYGLGAIKGLGQAVITSICQEREKNGDYLDLFDFCRRVNSHKINRRAIESLIRSGCMDALSPNRATLMTSLTNAIQMAGQEGRDRETGQNDMFSAQKDDLQVTEYIETPEWNEEQRLEGEKETLGLYLSGHPIEKYEGELNQIIDSKIDLLQITDSRSIIVAGLIVAIRTMQTKRGDRMAFVTLDDRTGRIELAVFSDVYHASRNLLVKDSLVVVVGQVSVDDYTGGYKMSAEKIFDIDQARSTYAQRLVIDINNRQEDNGFVGSLMDILSTVSDGECPVYLNYQSHEATAEIALGDHWKITPTSIILERLSALAGKEHIHVIYH